MKSIAKTFTVGVVAIVVIYELTRLTDAFSLSLSGIFGMLAFSMVCLWRALRIGNGSWWQHAFAFYFSIPLGIAFSVALQFFAWGVDRNLVPFEITIAMLLSPVIVFPIFYLICKAASETK
jgi:hypothetical protein